MSVGRRVAVVVAVIAVACSKTDASVPPPISGKLLQHPLSCGEIQAADLSGESIVVDGGKAQCAANGLTCPLLEASFARLCDGGKLPVARCVNFVWQASCAAAESDAGAADAPAG